MKKMEIIYIALLFIVYQMIFKLIGFSINTATYGLFVILISSYYFTKNLQFIKKPKQNSIFINMVIFFVFLLFYKNIKVFTLFLLFTLSQKFICYIFKRLSLKKKDKCSVVINVRNSMKIILDSSTIVFAIVLAFIIKFSLNSYGMMLRKEYIITYLGIFLVAYTYKEMGEKSWSYTNILDVLNILILNLFTAIVFACCMMIGENNDLSISILVTSLVLSTSMQLLGRFAFRLKRYYFKPHGKKVNKKRTLIYGAGEAGAIIAREYMTNPEFPYAIVGFIDDDPKKIESEIYTIKVLGNRNNIEEIINNEDIEEIIIALPSVNNMDVKKVLNEVSNIQNVKIKIVPQISEILSDENLTNQIREVRIEDLLGRDQVEINDESILGLIEGKTIFVTGGAGSIGSELARQIAKYNPLRLVTLDMNENDSYFLSLELKRKYENLDIITEICNIREKDKLEFLFNKYRPNVVFHAAAHKHVPLMEHNPEEAIKNNIFGTKKVAECADKYGVDRMVLISTDKAVNPTNLMGATKRACELVVADMNKKAKHTKYMAVRFGNVLGSNGSVIPIFKKLIAEGKNLTVTHKDITRYFMTIPEAAQLVIEAGSIGKGGEIFILDMGKPTRIYDLAKTMIRLSNSNVGIDIVGLRPGEKLYEELLYDVNAATKTENNKIFITKINEKAVDINDYYDKLMDVANHANVEEIKDMMKQVVVTYHEPVKNN